MCTQDLIHCLALVSAYWPNLLIDHIGSNGFIYFTNHKKISLRIFLDVPADYKLEYLIEVLEGVEE